MVKVINMAIIINILIINIMDFNKVININYDLRLKVGEENNSFTFIFKNFLKQNNFFFYKKFLNFFFNYHLRY